LRRYPGGMGMIRWRGSGEWGRCVGIANRFGDGMLRGARVKLGVVVIVVGVGRSSVGSGWLRRSTKVEVFWRRIQDVAEFSVSRRINVVYDCLNAVLCCCSSFREASSRLRMVAKR
jgi:hypothetical protein